MMTFIFAVIGGAIGGVIGCLMVIKIMGGIKDPFEVAEPEPPIIPLNLKDENADYLREQVKKLHG